MLIITSSWSKKTLVRAAMIKTSISVVVSHLAATSQSTHHKCLHCKELRFSKPLRGYHCVIELVSKTKEFAFERYGIIRTLYIIHARDRTRIACSNFLASSAYWSRKCYTIRARSSCLLFLQAWLSMMKILDVLFLRL